MKGSLKKTEITPSIHGSNHLRQAYKKTIKAEHKKHNNKTYKPKYRDVQQH